MTIQDTLDHVVERGELPFVVAMVGNSEGVCFSGQAGEAAPGVVADERTLFAIFSMTKAVGSFAAMMLVDQGKLSLDTPVGEIIPDWNRLRVLERWDGDQPVFRAPKVAATVRHLATHRSGLEYDAWSAEATKLVAWSGKPQVNSGLKSSLTSLPLTFDPGSRWGYGPSTDWLGQVVEAVDGRTIDAFCREEVFGPLGLNDMVFEPDGYHDRLASTSRRSEDGSFAPFQVLPPSKPEFYGMGHALFATAPDYMRFLRMLLNRGQLDGVRLISEKAFDQMLADQMEGRMFQTMRSQNPVLTADVELPNGTTHSVLGMRLEADLSARRKAGSLSWAGLCNTHFWMDPASDICGVFMTQLVPFVEPGFMAAYERFETAVYAEFGKV